jgi:2-polyprenyl-3-methyl-5-hydroxy-6-metoxy-1,4-benzoquinol methylase
LPRSKAELIERARLRNRTRKAAMVTEAKREWRPESVLLVGAGQGWTPIDIVVEVAATEGVPRVVATDLHRISNVPWPYVVADALALPFPDKSFDLVLSNAVIEHVGGVEEQRRFLAEHLRVAHHFILTTPNRWFFMETHTKALLRHWSPAWRAAQSHEFTRLLSKGELAELLPGGAKVLGSRLGSTFTAYGDCA